VILIGNLVAIAGFIALLTAGLLLVRRGRQSALILCALPFSIETVVQQQWAYVPLTKLSYVAFPVSLLQENLCVIAICLLARLTVESITDKQLGKKIAIPLTAVGLVACAGQTVLFALNHWHSEDPFLTRELVSPAAVAYTSIQWVAMAMIAVLGAYGVIVSARPQRSPLMGWSLIGVGAGALVALAVSILHFVSVFEVLHQQNTYLLEFWMRNLINLSASLIAIGLAFPTMFATIKSLVSQIRTRCLLAAVHSRWAALNVRDEPLVLDRLAGMATDVFSKRPTEVLYRRRIELKDFFRAHPDERGDRENRS